RCRIGATSFVNVTDCADAAVAKTRKRGASRSAFDIRTSAVRSPRMMRRFGGIRKAENLVLPAIALGIAAVLGVARCRSARPPDAAPDHRPAQVRLDGFLTSDGCRACHPSQYASWHASYHRTMTQIATPATVLTSFDGVTVETATGGLMQLEQRGQELW